jgi:hypothetical protein
MPYGSTPKKKHCFKMKYDKSSFPYMDAAYKFNAKLRAASAAGDLDSNPKFKKAVDSSFKMKGCPTCKGGKLKCACGKQMSDNLPDGRSRSAVFQKYGCKKRG